MDKTKAILILETLKEGMEGTKKDALDLVIDWIKSAVVDEEIYKMTPEQRTARIHELLQSCGYETGS